MSTNTPDRKRRSILVLSLCIHLALLYLLFFTKDHNFDTQQLLFEQLLAQQKEKLQKEELSEEEQQEVWATLKARASDFGATVLFQEDPEFVASPGTMVDQPLEEQAQAKHSVEEQSNPEQQTNVVQKEDTQTDPVVKEKEKTKLKKIESDESNEHIKKPEHTKIEEKKVEQKMVAEDQEQQQPEKLPTQNIQQSQN